MRRMNAGRQLNRGGPLYATSSERLWRWHERSDGEKARIMAISKTVEKDGSTENGGISKTVEKDGSTETVGPWKNAVIL